MSGVYVHIPFCKNKCTYCDFHFSTTYESYRTQMIDALCKELRIRLNDGSENIKTLYFGGGTPSLLSANDWENLITTCSEFFSIADLQEFTIEANPDDVNLESLKFWKKLGINRLSIGVQSFRNEDLIWMNRAHNAEQSLSCIRLAQDNGFENLSIDLMYGLPNQSAETWRKQVEKVATLGVPHVSAYCLTVEERTALKKKVTSGNLVIPNDELVEDQFNILIDTLASFGLEQYEISNFSKPGLESIHNSNYWLGEKYLGIGPSAHGFTGESRYWNIANNQQYIKAIAQDELPQSQEVLSSKDRFNELILTGLRTKWGVKMKDLQALIPFESYYLDVLNNLIEAGVIEQTNEKIRLNQKHRIKADHYASVLFVG